MPFPWCKTVLKWFLLDTYFSLPNCFLLPNLWDTINQFIRCFIKLSSLYLNLTTARITPGENCYHLSKDTKALWISSKQRCCQRKSFSMTTEGFEPIRTALLRLDRKNPPIPLRYKLIQTTQKRLVRLTIKRHVLLCTFLYQDSLFKS